MSTNLERFLVIIAVIFILIAIFGFWASANLYNANQFNNIANKTLEQPEVKNAISAEIVDQILSDRPIVKQVVGNPMQSFISGLLGSQLFLTIFDRASTAFHNYLFTNNQQAVTLDIGAISSLVKPVVTAVSPSLSDQLPTNIPSSITIIPANALPNVNKWLKPFVEFGPVLGLIGMGLLIFTVYKEKDRAIILKRIGLYLAVGAVVMMLAIPYFGNLVNTAATNQNLATVISSLYGNFTSTLFTQLLILLAIAILLFVLGYFWPKILDNYNERRINGKS